MAVDELWVRPGSGMCGKHHFRFQDWFQEYVLGLGTEAVCQLVYLASALWKLTWVLLFVQLESLEIGWGSRGYR